MSPSVGNDSSLSGVQLPPGLSASGSQEIDFVPIAESPYTPSASINNEPLARALSDKLVANGWSSMIRSDYKANSIHELVEKMDANPLNSDNKLHSYLYNNLSSLRCCPLLVDPQSQKIVVAVSVLDQNGEDRKAGAFVFALTQSLGFTSTQKPEETLTFLVLNSGDYDLVAKRELIFDRTQRHNFLHHYSDQAVGAEIRDNILAKAVEWRASDIHIEPVVYQEREVFQVRYRIDGVLQADPKFLSFDRGKAVISTVKLKGRMDIANRIEPQDGQFVFDEEDVKRNSFVKGFSCRVSSVPVVGDGESVVVRVLKPSNNSLQLEQLGLPNQILRNTRELLASPHGIILMTGPTGSGKTTTLYSMLHTINDGQKKIYTIEQPVEMRISGLTQTEVNVTAGRTFDKLLRAALRHDPDVILVGEIRDGETATTAIQAAQTGHLVFATLHTNSAIASLIRLKELGVEPSKILDSVKGVYAQRLVRSCCSKCSETYDAAGELNKLLKLSEEEKIKVKVPLTRPKAEKDESCNDCHGTGYFGRRGVTELWLVTSYERDLINSGVISERQIRLEAMKTQKFLPLAIRGLELALNGSTSLSEVTRAVASIEEMRELKSYIKSYIEKTVAQR